MQLSINGKQVQVSEALNEHIERLVTAISEKYFGDPLDGSVTVSKEGNNFRTDIAVHVGREMFVRGQGIAADAYASVDQAGEHIDKRLRRFKRRVRDHHRGNGGAKVAAQQYVLAGELPASEPPVEDEWQPVVVAEMTTSIEDLSVEEAVMRLELGELQVVMFRNRAHGEMNVIYRRSDGNIGWIDPKGLAQA
ncbi:ribosome-associated translation inhibitor RaiA [uncultured Nisaea sp.]|jgi:ribosomal subunit interface protein|uniref:ribosome hibernation-promoting factor, HPF/YfiA family n=1 Tax=uncultured Nisaea sp. TaxID=538215 RepID=UPI0030ED4519|tara:strand:- start:7 stop:585 length:579 start_codon:yes stop_codon:yes gene_type:complete